MSITGYEILRSSAL